MEILEVKIDFIVMVFKCLIIILSDEEIKSREELKRICIIECSWWKKRKYEIFVKFLFYYLFFLVRKKEKFGWMRCFLILFL